MAHFKLFFMWREKKIKYFVQGSVTNVVDELHFKEMTSHFIKRVLSGIGEWQSCNSNPLAGFNCQQATRYVKLG